MEMNSIEKMRASFKALIRQEMQSNNWHAMRMGMTPAVLKNFLEGNTTPHALTLGKIAKYLRENPSVTFDKGIPQVTCYDEDISKEIS